MLRKDHWSLTSLPFQEIMTDQPTVQPTEQQTYMRNHREVTFPLIVKTKTFGRKQKSDEETIISVREEMALIEPTWHTHRPALISHLFIAYLWLTAHSRE